jgi:hypothetical protein
LIACLKVSSKLTLTLVHNNVCFTDFQFVFLPSWNEITDHPDLHITGYRAVTVELYTHSVGGLTHNDFVIASLLDKLPVEYSPKFLQEHSEIGQQPFATAQTE